MQKQNVLQGNKSDQNLHRQCSTLEPTEHCSVKLCINNRLIDIKELVTLCNDHSTHCNQFSRQVKDSSTPYKDKAKKKRKGSLTTLKKEEPSLSLVEVGLKSTLKERRPTAQPLSKVYKLVIS